MQPHGRSFELQVSFVSCLCPSCASWAVFLFVCVGGSGVRVCVGRGVCVCVCCFAGCRTGRRDAQMSANNRCHMVAGAAFLTVCAAFEPCKSAWLVTSSWCDRTAVPPWHTQHYGVTGTALVLTATAADHTAVLVGQHCPAAVTRHM
jgi:hypothetical protein